MFSHFLSFLFGGALTFFVLRYLSRVNLDIVVILLTGKKLKEIQKNSLKGPQTPLLNKRETIDLDPKQFSNFSSANPVNITNQTSTNTTPNVNNKLSTKLKDGADNVSYSQKIVSSEPVVRSPDNYIHETKDLANSANGNSSSHFIPSHNINSQTHSNNLPNSTAINNSNIMNARSDSFHQLPTITPPTEKKHIRQGSIQGGIKSSKPENGLPGTPSLYRQKSGEFSDVRPKRNVSNSPKIDLEVDFSGWMEIGSKTPVKLVWATHFFYLHDSWLSWYKNETKRADQCYGWIKLKEVELETQLQKLKLYIKHKTGKPIFHRHGPDNSVPPTPRSSHLFHRKSATGRLRFKDEKTLQQWAAALQRAIEPTNKVNTEGNEEEIESSDTGSDDISDLSINEDLIPIEKSNVLPVIEPEEKRIVLVQKENKNSNTQLKSSEIEKSIKDSTLINPENPSEDTVNSIPTSPENREGLLSILKSAIGFDITTVSLPVSLFEPTSFLQRMCELLVYYDILNKADAYEDSCHRMTFVTTFAISLYASLTRTTKPFNPFLGETFEYVKEGKFKFLAEQVSHHPPIGACIAETEHFIYWQEQGLKTSFGGNSLACESLGNIHLILKTSQDHYVWSNIKSVVHNCIVGKMWIDHYGETKITNYKTGDSAKLKLRKCGWFGKGQAEVEAWILDSQGQTRVTLEGKWNESLRWTYVGGPPFDAPQPIWVHTNKNDKNNHWNLTSYAQELCYVDDNLKAILPKTDSRLRTDRIVMESRDLKKAAQEKSKLEKEQRALRKLRENQGKVWVPQYFIRREDGLGGPDYSFNGKYWEERNNLIARVGAKQLDSKKND